MKVYLGWPGSVHDARILANSQVFAKGAAGTLAPNSIRVFAGVPVQVVNLRRSSLPASAMVDQAISWDWTEHKGEEVQYQTQ